VPLNLRISNRSCLLTNENPTELFSTARILDVVSFSTIIRSKSSLLSLMFDIVYVSAVIDSVGPRMTELIVVTCLSVSWSCSLNSVSMVYRMFLVYFFMFLSILNVFFKFEPTMRVTDFLVPMLASNSIILIHRCTYFKSLLFNVVNIHKFKVYATICQKLYCKQFI
jgi:hypothetical protein